jgi:hypothetical protein
MSLNVNLAHKWVNRSVFCCAKCARNPLILLAQSNCAKCAQSAQSTLPNPLKSFMRKVAQSAQDSVSIPTGWIAGGDPIRP